MKPAGAVETAAPGGPHGIGRFAEFARLHKETVLARILFSAGCGVL